MASASSAKAGSKALSGKEALGPWMDLRADSRREEREEGRRGVVGRLGVRGREVERWWAGVWESGIIIGDLIFGDYNIRCLN